MEHITHTHTPPYTEIRKQVETYREEVTSLLAELIRIPSVRSAPAPNAPFGPTVLEALKKTDEIYCRYGYSSRSFYDSGYMLTDVLNPEEPYTIGIYSHADVVPVDDDRWTLGEPFEAKLLGDLMVGRGTVDNKSSIIAALFTAKVISDMKIPFTSRLQLFTGSNEESGMADLAQYLKEQTPPHVSLVPDANFPIYRGEKGILRFWAKSRDVLASVYDFRGGTTFNTVLGEAVVSFKKPYDFKNLPDNIHTFTDENGLHLTGVGLSSHAAFADKGISGAFVLAQYLATADCLPEGDRTMMANVAMMLSDAFGSGLHIRRDDPVFSALTAANGMVKMEDGHFCFSIDIRYGTTFAPDELADTLKNTLAEYGFDMEIHVARNPFLIDEKDPTLIRLLRVYGDCTGTESPQSHINKGGTYARFIPHAYSMGPRTIPNPPPVKLPAGHGAPHQPDEWITVSGLLDGIAIMTEMVLCLDETKPFSDEK